MKATGDGRANKPDPAKVGSGDDYTPEQMEAFYDRLKVAGAAEGLEWKESYQDTIASMVEQGLLTRREIIKTETIARAKPRGKVQSGVVGCLATSGRWRWAGDIVAAMYPGGADASKVNAVRRAIGQLVGRGEVQSIYTSDPNRGGSRKLAAWLPDQSGPPPSSALPTREQVGQDILDFLGQLDAAGAAKLWAGFKMPEWARNDEDCRPGALGVPWQPVARHLLERHSPENVRKDTEATVRPTIRRALHAVARDSRVVLVTASDGRKRHPIFIQLGGGVYEGDDED